MHRVFHRLQRIAALRVWVPSRLTLALRPGSRQGGRIATRWFAIRGARSSLQAGQRGFVADFFARRDSERPAPPVEVQSSQQKDHLRKVVLYGFCRLGGYCCGLGVVLAVEGLAGVVVAVAAGLVAGVVLVGRGVVEAAGFAGAGTPDWAL